MFDIDDIYRHLMAGGDKQDLYVCLEREIEIAEKKVKAEKEAEQKEKELANRINDARKFAIAALKDYFALVNPNVTENVINFVLDTLGTVEIEVNEIRGSRDGNGFFEQTIDLTDEEWKRIWNTVFPFHFKRK